MKITAEIEIPEDFVPPQAGLTDVAVLWWLVTLMRLRASTVTFMPLMSDESFSASKSLPQRAKFRPLEIKFGRRVPESAPLLLIRAEDLEWVGKHWVSGTHLMAGSPAFNLLILALDAAALASLEDRASNCFLCGVLWSHSSPRRAPNYGFECPLSSQHTWNQQVHVSATSSATSRASTTLDPSSRTRASWTITARWQTRMRCASASPFASSRRTKFLPFQSLEDRLFGT